MAERLRKSDQRAAYARTHPLALTIAAGAVLTGIVFLAIGAPQDSALVATTAPAFAALWLVMSIIGGILTLWGAWALSPRWEAGGLTLISTVCAADIYAILDVRGPVALIAVSPILFVALGTAIRAVVITQLPGGSSWKG